MSRDLLCRIGAALYGEHWYPILAHDLGVPRRTVERWAAGDARPPPTLPRDLARLVAARQDVLGQLYREVASSLIRPRPGLPYLEWVYSRETIRRDAKGVLNIAAAP